jgi:hypothetical protein
MNLQGCKVLILQFDIYKFEILNFYCAQITKLQNYLYVDFHIWKITNVDLQI